MSVSEGVLDVGTRSRSRRGIAPLALTASLAFSSISGTAWSEIPTATAVGGDAPSGAPDSVAGPAGSSAAAAEIAATGADAGRGGDAFAYVIPNAKPPFMAMEPHSALFAAFDAVGGAAMAIDQMSEGSKVLTENGIDDPGPSISKAIAARLAQPTHAAVVGIPIDPKHHAVRDLATAGTDAHARYVVVAATLFWGFAYYAPDMTHFHVTYMAGMDLIDTKSGAVIVKAKCNYHPVKAQEHATMDELMADHAAALKAQLRNAADHCAGELLTKLPSV